MSAFPTLMSPLAVGRHMLRNRIVFTAHGEQWATGGRLNEIIIAYHERRARGGAGLLITFGSASVYRTASTSNVVALWDEANEPALTEMARRVHREGAVLMAQATHRGPRERPGGIDDVLHAPSPLPGAHPIGRFGTPHVLTIAEIEAIVQAFGEAAARLERCGFDGIELNALGTSLFEQFWSPALNRRKDGYGGSFHNRMRFTREVIERVAAMVSGDFLVGFRLSGELFTDQLALTSDDMVEIAAALDGSGRLDLMSVTGGSGFSVATHSAVAPNDSFAEATYTATARRFRERVSSPVIVSGRLLRPEQAERALADGDCDLTGMTRAMIADPDLPRHAAHGTSERIRPCIAINEGCRRVTLGQPLSCSVNPVLSDPSLDDLEPAERPRNVVVIGAGPAGLEAARVGALRGHCVTLMEREERVGGQMNAYAALVGHANLLNHVGWLEREVERLGVDVRIGVSADARSVRDGQFEAAILCAGARARLPPELAEVANAVTDVAFIGIPADAVRGRTVVVYDLEGRLTGASAACLAARAGARSVELVVPQEAALEHLEPPNKPSIQRQLAALGVRVMPHHHLVAARDGTARVRDAWSGRERDLEDEIVVSAGYRQARPDLSATLTALRPGLDILLAGDCRAPRLLRNAVLEGARAGAAL